LTFYKTALTYKQQYYSVIFFIVLFFCISNDSKAQTLKSQIFNNQITTIIPTIELPFCNNDSLINFYNNLGKNQPFVFAKIFNQKIKTNKNGLWIKNNDNSNTWLCQIKSLNAFSLNFTFESINIPLKSSFYILDIKKKLSYGPYTSKSINKDSTLFIEPIPGDELLIELDLPPLIDTLKNFFTITQIGHDFRNFYKEEGSTRAKSESCEHDINCGIGLDWQTEKRSIVKIIFNSSIGTESCTGALINNTTNNELPYILTANHCIKDSKTASNAVFYFNYENTNCGGSDASANSYTISGSTLMATSKDSAYTKLDFSLLRLKTQPPKSLTPYYSGWSIKSNLVNKVVCIHHPKGDAKKVSYSNGFIKNGSFTDNGYLKDTHWQIALWDTGATEPGSSGCPLYNTNHQIIGDLSGGDSKCTNPVNDYFEKLYKSWDFFPDSSNQLKYWLDPINLGVTECNGYDPLIGSENPVTNVVFNEELTTYNFGKTYKGGWTGFNEPKITQCADRFSGIKNQYIYAIKFPIQLFKKTADISKIILKIWDGIDKPDSLLFEQQLITDSIVNGKYYCIRLQNRIKAGANFFIGFDFKSLVNNDSIYLFTAKNRTNKLNSLYFEYKNEWLESKYLGLYSSLGIEIYVTNNITTARATNKLPEKLISINYDSYDSLITKELFHSDSVCNYAENDWLQIHYFKDNKGFWSGTNEGGITQIAEKYNINEDNYLSGVKIAVAKNNIVDINTKISISIMTGKEYPDSLKYFEEVNAKDLKENYFNIIKFDNPIYIDSSFFLVINFENVITPDSFAVYMGNPIDISNKKHSYFKSNKDWFNYFMYDISDNLGISIETINSQYVYDTNSTNYRYIIKNIIKEPNTLFKSFFIYPNPSTYSKKSITLNFGNYFSSNINIVIYDVYGRIICSPSPTFDLGNSVKISTENLIAGVYYVKVIIDDIHYQPLPLIITH